MDEDRSEYGNLVDYLAEKGYLKDPDYAAAFKEIRREDFLPDYSKERAAEDRPIPIGEEQTSSQPLTVAFMLSELKPRKGDHILDVGMGGGWQAGLLSKIVGKEGKVTTVERLRSLYDLGKANLEKYGFVSSGVTEVIFGDASKEIGSNGPYDRIISAAEVDEVPELWKKSLVVGGTMVFPTKGKLVVAHKTHADEFETKEYFGFGFTPLIES